jgi:hypothetical protein
MFSSRRCSFVVPGMGTKSSGWDENRTSLEGDVLEVAVRNRRRVLTHVPVKTGSAPAGPRHYFPTEE